MKEVGLLRLYSKRINKNLFVITSSEISEEYKDGKFVSYASAKPVVLRAKTTLLNDFLKSIPELNYKSMIKRIGFQTRIECKSTFEYSKKIKRIRLYFDFCSSNIFFCDALDLIISWDGSLIPPEWQKDEKFMSLNQKLCKEYDALYTNLKNQFTVIYNGAECTVGDFMLMKANKRSESSLPIATNAVRTTSLTTIVEYVNDKLTIKQAPVKDKTIKSFPLRTSVSALLSATAACALVLSCGIFSLTGGSGALLPNTAEKNDTEHIESFSPEIMEEEEIYETLIEEK